MLSCSFSSLPSISPSPPTTQSISLSAASTVHLVVTVSPAPLLLLSILLRSRRRSSMCNWKRQIYSAGVRTRQIYLFLSLRCTSTTPCCLRSLHLHPKSTWLLLNHIRPVPIQTPSPPLRTHTSLDEEASPRRQRHYTCSTPISKQFKINQDDVLYFVHLHSTIKFHQPDSAQSIAHIHFGLEYLLLPPQLPQSPQPTLTTGNPNARSLTPSFSELYDWQLGFSSVKSS
ncbi:hypothetical protein F2Q69_00048628 [Brassica cretica]|uniref:Uncharacterized protein n=1 Tax=Brassica cretica TaxID=69181 RepID=A0A8S9PVC4_BRACR|nr:hypothetical protein F2Q69_00048628 [Brassica cretica]